jgi:hypothetical protein
MSSVYALFIQVVKHDAVNNRQSIYYTHSFVVPASCISTPLHPAFLLSCILCDVAMSFYSFCYLPTYPLILDHSDSLAGTWLSKNISDFIAKLPEENIQISIYYSDIIAHYLLMIIAKLWGVN